MDEERRPAGRGNKSEARSIPRDSEGASPTHAGRDSEGASPQHAGRQDDVPFHLPPLEESASPPEPPPRKPPAARGRRTQGSAAAPAPDAGERPPAPPAGGRPAPRRPRRPRRRSGWYLPRSCVIAIIGAFTLLCGGLTLSVALAVALLGARIENQLGERVSQVDDWRNFESSFIHDRYGEILYESFREGRRTYVALEDIPPALIDATLAIEDDSFYSNPGIDVAATLRAFLQYVGLARGSSGGSTITQQLVRNLLFTPERRAERSIDRKLEEIALAMVLTQRKGKDEILELYLNEIYYGNLAYGAQAAASTFFNKDVSRVTLGEPARLAGLPQAPASLDPLNPEPEVQEAVNVRWLTVLDRMLTEGFIDEAQRDAAIAAGLAFDTPDVPFHAPHFIVYVQTQLEPLLVSLGHGPELSAGGGLKVYTTLDLRINDMAQEAVRQQVARLAGNNVGNGAVIVTRPDSGEILAMVGSADYYDDSIDGRVNVTAAMRQPGSTVKPMTYAAALEQGMTPAEILWDTKLDVRGRNVPPDWPRNYDKRFHGPQRMRSALANSYNIPAVITLRRIGVPGLLEIMERFGVESLGRDASRYGLSLTLGGGDVTLLELAQAYGVFANEGTRVPLHSIRCVLSRENEILYELDGGCPHARRSDAGVSLGAFGEQVLDPRIAFLISDMLADNVARSPAMGANSPLHVPGLPGDAAVKTGTTDDVRDNWTIGYTRNVVVGAWVGNSDGTPMVDTSGLSGAAPVWNAVMSGIYNDQGMLASFARDSQLLNDNLQPPAGLQQTSLCHPWALTEPATACARRVNEWLLTDPVRPPNTVPAGSDVRLQEVEPGIFRVLAYRIPTELASGIRYQNPDSRTPPPPPLYCQVPQALEAAAISLGAREQLFLAPPLSPSPQEVVEAELFARSRNLAFLPSIQCNAALLQPPRHFPSQVTTAVITSPQNGAVLSRWREVPVLGSVIFTPEQAQFYKVEIIGGDFDDWVTLGSTHENSVPNGQLETLHVPSLKPGWYHLRLVVIALDGNYLQQPFEISFSVE